jgi:hypothetical protein
MVSENKNLNKNYELFERNYANLFLELINKNPEDVAGKIGAHIDSKGELILDFFEKSVLVDLNKSKIYVLNYKYIHDNLRKSNKERHLLEPDSEKFEPLDLFSSTIILSFLLNADGTPLSGEWILYRELPGGLFYATTIPGVLQPLVKKYENGGGEFLEKLLEIGGEINKNFKFSGIIYPFKKFPVLFIIDEKDEEFDANVRVLFDSSASHYLKTDIIKTLLVYIVKKLIT